MDALYREMVIVIERPFDEPGSKFPLILCSPLFLLVANLTVSASEDSAVYVV